MQTDGIQPDESAHDARRAATQPDMTPGARKVAIVGPTHPYSGGVSHHTTTLANRLRVAGVAAEVVSWKAQYPKFLRDGDTHVDPTKPEVKPAERVSAPLTWYNPFGWIAAGRRLRNHDLVVYSSISPLHAFPFVAMSWGVGRHVPQVVIAHNVVPQGGGNKLHRVLNRLFFRRLTGVITHSSQQKLLAERDAGAPIRVANVVMPLPDLVGVPTKAEDPARTRPRLREPLRVLFFGMVRPYKGLDVLIDALRQVDNVTLTVAGEFWEPVAEVAAAVSQAGLSERVTLRGGYVPVSEITELFGNADVLALPYRGGSASFNVSLAHRFGIPVVATDVGTFSRDVRSGVDGFIVPKENSTALAKALATLASPDTYAQLQKAVPFDSGEQSWTDYVETTMSFLGN